MIAVVYNGGAYRIHDAKCADLKRERRVRKDQFYPDGTDLAAIAAEEMSDFADEYNDDEITAMFMAEAYVLPCAKVAKFM